MKGLCYVALVGLVISVTASAQQPDELYKEISVLDSIVFTAFNRCDIKTFGSMFTEDLEFYHDKGGLTDYLHTINAIKENCERKLGLTRTLVSGSMEVYPIGDFGAVQIASHRFCHVEKGREDCGTFKFVHVWKKDKGTWKISRVISYDH
ncbi:MAG: nuclear transport factor 2 family protein [Flammeovirgaceae bacterium]|nr:MAG: nuclear transport factor 2 family protein [Flammeovirgaceae bacterium]